ncbi:hypothetical protein SESBI_06870 [Sesbania bispinosa]|nr:hypothetical protein SESBI_06870 [Sesbania bispinosa]
MSNCQFPSPPDDNENQKTLPPANCHAFHPTTSMIGEERWSEGDSNSQTDFPSMW